VFHKIGEFLEQLRDYQLLKENLHHVDISTAEVFVIIITVIIMGGENTCSRAV
jgi:hypothetical protein